LARNLRLGPAAGPVETASLRYDKPVWLRWAICLEMAKTDRRRSSRWLEVGLFPMGAIAWRSNTATIQAQSAKSGAKELLGRLPDLHGNILIADRCHRYPATQMKERAGGRAVRFHHCCYGTFASKW